MSWQWLTNLFDKYERVARLYPAILTVAPIVWSVLALFPDVTKSFPSTLSTLVAVAVALYLMSSIARFLGGLAEKRLLARWGSWPTTIVLRHQDSTFDQFTKARYHRALEKLSGLAAPTPAEEHADAKRADDFYRSSTIKLKDGPAARANALVLEENISYGFRRNLYGLRPVALLVAFLSAALTGALWWLGLPEKASWPVILNSAVQYPHLPILVLSDVSYAGVLALVVREPFVRQAGDQYARALLATLDS